MRTSACDYVGECDCGCAYMCECVVPGLLMIIVIIIVIIIIIIIIIITTIIIKIKQQLYSARSNKPFSGALHGKYTGK